MCGGSVPKGELSRREVKKGEEKERAGEDVLDEIPL